MRQNPRERTQQKEEPLSPQKRAEGIANLARLGRLYLSGDTEAYRQEFNKIYPNDPLPEDWKDD